MLNKIKEFNEDDLANALIDARIKFYNDIVAAKPTQRKFLKGWLNRAESTRRALGEF